MNKPKINLTSKKGDRYSFKPMSRIVPRQIDFAKKSIFAALAFFDIFDYPLTLEEIQKYLYKSNLKISLNKIKEILNKSSNISERNGLFFLKGRENICDSLLERRAYYEKFLKKIKKYCKFFKIIPFLRFVSLCNIMGAPKKESDIDLFIVAKSNRLFIVRILVTLLFHLFGIRRHKSKISGRFCLSFYITDHRLNLSKIFIKPEDPYMYYWLRTMRLIFGDEKLYREFLLTNGVVLSDWNLSSLIEDNGFFLKNIRKIFEKILSGKSGDFFEKKLGSWQKKRAFKKQKKLEPNNGVIISDDMLKFHDKDRRRLFLNLWKNKLLTLIF